MKKQSKTAQIRTLLEKGLSVAQIAKKLSTSPSSVYQVRWRVQPDPVTGLLEPVQPDPVNHPPHYKAGGIETIDFIEAKRLGYHLGNVVKYISRAQHKGGMQDLLKAQWYLNRAIEKGEVNE
jgi:DNA-binding CsgD family transcriptional regulator